MNDPRKNILDLEIVSLHFNGDWAGKVLLIAQLGSSAAQNISYLDIWRRLKRPLNVMATKTLKTETKKSMHVCVYVLKW